jgi:hypothetical protein
MTDVSHTLYAKPRSSLRCDQLIPVHKVVIEKEQLEKGPDEEEKKTGPLEHWTLDNQSETTPKKQCVKSEDY